MNVDDALDRLDEWAAEFPGLVPIVATVRDELRIGEMRRIEGEKMLTELQRLREERDSWQRAAEMAVETWEKREQKQYERAEAAEAEVRRLREERDALIRDRERWRLEWQAEVEAAEAEVRRLREELRHADDYCSRPMGVCFDRALLAAGEDVTHPEGGSN